MTAGTAAPKAASTTWAQLQLGAGGAGRGGIGFSTTDSAQPAALQPAARSHHFRRAGELCQRHGLALWPHGAAPQHRPPRAVLR